MRSDMKKITVERRRVGGNISIPIDPPRAPRAFREFDSEEYDRLPMRQSMKAHIMKRGQKALNEFLSPLRRWLAKQAGRRWDDVSSEIHSVMTGWDPVNAHVLGHVSNWVTQQGKVLPSWASVIMYVDEEGILRRGAQYDSRLNRIKPQAKKPKSAKDALRTQEGELVIAYEGKYYATKEDFKASAYRYSYYITSDGFSPHLLDDRGVMVLDGMQGVHNVVRYEHKVKKEKYYHHYYTVPHTWWHELSKRSLGHKELVKLGLTK